MDEFKVSVIIPVYNAEKYVKKAVLSALDLPEVGEILLIEDKSPDNCLEICRELASNFDKVHLHQHPDKKNHGGSASRNLGIKLATCEFIAFLDADDYYLPNRFKKDKKLLLSDPSIDGVYNALGIHYYTETGKLNFIKAGFEFQELTTVNKEVPPDELFSVLINANQEFKGEFHTNTITVRQRVYQNIGVFNEQLEMQEDPHLWRRMAAFCKIVSGEITNPVSMRGVHDDNRMVNMQKQKICRYQMWTDLKKVFDKSSFAKDQPFKYKLFKKVYHKELIDNSKSSIAFYHLILLVFQYPEMFWKDHYFFDSRFLDILGRNWFTLHFISFKNRFSA